MQLVHEVNFHLCCRGASFTAKIPVIASEMLRGLIQYFPANAGIVPSYRPRSLYHFLLSARNKPFFLSCSTPNSHSHTKCLFFYTFIFDRVINVGLLVVNYFLLSNFYTLICLK
jgi:hypothetical protein